MATDLQSFRDYHLYAGLELEQMRGTGTEVAAFLDVAGMEGWQVIPAPATMAMSSGKVTTAAYAHLKDALLSAAGDARPLDAVLLALHGAMVVDDLDDSEGDLLAALRALLGPAVPIVASLDLHGNVTPTMVGMADALVGFNTCPHTDLYDTGYRTAKLLARILRHEVRPAMAMVRVPLVVPPDTMDTGDGPLGEIVGLAKRMEASGDVLSASVFCVQPWLDIPGLASAVLAVTNDDAAAAAAAAGRLARAYWQARKRFQVQLYSAEAAVRAAVAEGAGPVVLSDSADSIGSGATGDATGIFRALIDASGELPGAALHTVVDPEAAELAIAAGVGAQVAMDVGGKRDRTFNRPVRLDGQVRTVFAGRFRLSGPSYAGLEMNMGRTAVVQRGRLSVVITSLPTWTHHPDFYRAVGLHPERARIVVTKSNILFKASYQAMAHRILWVDAPGLSSPNILCLPFARVSRPLYPFDDWETLDERATVRISHRPL